MTEEQKAEEYKENKRHKSIRADVRTVQIDYESYLNNLKQAFLDGYKECQKEHEWHYVKDGDLPKDMENVIINAFDYGINTCYVAHRLNGKWKSNCSSETFVRVIAWKEIVPPKEIE